MSLLLELGVLSAFAGVLYAVHSAAQPIWSARDLALDRPPAGAARRTVLFLSVFVLTLLLAVSLLYVSLWTRGMLASPAELIQLSHKADVNWYETIANGGYHNPHTYAFWPLFPLVARGAMSVFPLPFHTAGALVSLVCLLATALGFARYFSQRPPREAVAFSLLFLLFPASFFLLIAYSEALYLALSFFCLWCFARNRPILGGLLGMAAATTRYSGVFLFVALLAAELLARGFRIRPRTLIGILLIPLGTLGFALFCATQVGDPLEMMEAQAKWRVEVLPTNVFRSIFHKDLWIAIRTNPFRWWPEWWSTSPGFYEFLLRFNLQATLNRGLPLIAVPLSVWMIYRATAMPLAWRLYAFILAFFPMLTIPDAYLRGIQVDFPLFLYAAQILAPRPFRLGAIASLSALSLAFIVWGFVSGYFS